MQAPWTKTKTGVTLEKALEWAAGAMGQRRGWTLRWSDGGTLSCVRRTDPSATATWTPGSLRRNPLTGVCLEGCEDVRRSSHSVRIGGNTTPGWVVVPTKK